MNNILKVVWILCLVSGLQIDSSAQSKYMVIDIKGMPTVEQTSLRLKKGIIEGNHKIILRSGDEVTLCKDKNYFCQVKGPLQTSSSDLQYKNHKKNFLEKSWDYIVSCFEFTNNPDHKEAYKNVVAGSRGEDTLYFPRAGEILRKAPLLFLWSKYDHESTTTSITIFDDHGKMIYSKPNLKGEHLIIDKLPKTNSKYLTAQYENEYSGTKKSIKLNITKSKLNKDECNLDDIDPVLHYLCKAHQYQSNGLTNHAAGILYKGYEERGDSLLLNAIFMEK